jgi:threonine dehydrogenase-like Zn-dependent dehydrogenase
MVSFSCGKCRYCVEGKPTMCVGNRIHWRWLRSPVE